MVERLYVTIGIFCHDRVWPNEDVLCCDRAILCHDIVGQARKIFYRD